jgi:hypothetical protein
MGFRRFNRLKTAGGKQIQANRQLVTGNRQPLEFSN